MLKFRTENLGQIAVVNVFGQLVNGPEIEVLRESVLSQSFVSMVVLDLQRVTRIDARGLGLLLEVREQLESKGIEFRLVNVAPLVQQILRITCLDSVFEISSDAEILALDSVESAFNSKA